MLKSEGLGSRVVSGATYQFLGMLLRTVVSFGSTAALARLLVPADFGYVAMAMVVTEFAVLFANFGFSNLLIQRRTITRLHIDTVFWASVVLGAVLTVAVFIASFFATALFDDATVGELLRFLCLTFVIGSLATIPNVVLARKMRFRTDFWIQAATVGARATLAIALAWAGHGVWSLAVAAIAGVLVQTTLSLAAVPYLPRFRFAGTLLTSTWRTSGSYFGGGLLFYANMNVDLLLIGRELGATSLGYYQSARALTDEIRSRIAIPLQHVLFPAISALQLEPARMQAVVSRSGRMLAAVVVPVGFGISAVAPELVRVLYGPQWTAMTPLMVTFGFSAALKAATAIVTPVFNACNRVELALKYNAVGTALLIAAIWMASRFGIEAVAIAVALVSIYSLAPFIAGIRLVGLRLSEGWRILGAPFIAAAIMWVAIAALREGLSNQPTNAVALLALFVPVGAAIYVAVLHLQSRQYWIELSDLFQRVVQR